MKTPIYVDRKMLNAQDLVSWAKEQGFKQTLSADDVHVTVSFSRSPVDLDNFKIRNDKITVKGGKRTIEPLGDKGAVVLKFESNLLHKFWKQNCEAGCSWDYDSYQPHVTITYDGTDLDLSKVTPPKFELVFGKERKSELDLDYLDKVKEK